MRDAVDLILDQWHAERPDLDPAPMGVIGRLSRMNRFIDRRLRENFARDGLERWEFDVLATLRRHGGDRPLRAGELVESSMLTSGAVTNRIDRLIDRGLVTREVDPENRRQVLIGLTRAGRDLVDRVVAGHLETERGMLTALSAREQTQLAGLLRKLLVSYGDGS